MRQVRSVLCVLSTLSMGCLASDPLHGSLCPVASTTVIVFGATPSTAPTPPAAPLEVATPAVDPPPETPGMLRGEVFAIPEGTRQLPDFRELRPMGTWLTPELNVSQRNCEQGFPGVNGRTEWFAIRYTGTFRLSDAGQYRFRVFADDGVRLVIDGDPVVTNDGIHGADWGEGAVVLRAGEHRVVVEYFQGPRFDVALQVFWSRPGQPEAIFRVDG